MTLNNFGDLYDLHKNHKSRVNKHIPIHSLDGTIYNPELRSISANSKRKERYDSTNKSFKLMNYGR